MSNSTPSLKSYVSPQAVSIMSKLVNEMQAKLVKKWGPAIVDLNEFTNSTIVANPPNAGAAEDAVEDFLSAIVDQLVLEHDFDEDEAINLVFSCAEELALEGSLDPIPDEGDDEADAAWLAQASSVSFANYVLAQV